jgi:hypothetical protein
MRFQPFLNKNNNKTCFIISFAKCLNLRFGQVVFWYCVLFSLDTSFSSPLGLAFVSGSPVDLELSEIVI